MRRLWPALMLLLAACDAPTIPARAEAYDFRLAEGGLVFHWPSGSLVRIHVSGGPDAHRALRLAEAADRAIDAWNAAVLYGEFRLQRTEDLADADILLRFADAPLEVATPDPVRCPFAEGRAVTSFCPSDGAAAGGAGRLLVYPLLSGGTGRVRFVTTLAVGEENGALFQAQVTHEIGHTLGIFTHPPLSVGRSVMFLLPTDSLPTAADRATLQVLYHTPSDLVLEPSDSR